MNTNAIEVMMPIIAHPKKFIHASGALGVTSSQRHAKKNATLTSAAVM
jgi:hypothetical protein